MHGCRLEEVRACETATRLNRSMKRSLPAIHTPWNPPDDPRPPLQLARLPGGRLQRREEAAAWLRHARMHCTLTGGQELTVAQEHDGLVDFTTAYLSRRKASDARPDADPV